MNVSRSPDTHDEQAALGHLGLLLRVQHDEAVPQIQHIGGPLQRADVSNGDARARSASQLLAHHPLQFHRLGMGRSELADLAVATGEPPLIVLPDLVNGYSDADTGRALFEAVNRTRIDLLNLPEKPEMDPGTDRGRDLKPAARP